MTFRMRKTAGLVVIVVVALWGCVTQEGAEVGGQRYGVTEGVFHGRWWNYYERGSSWLAGAQAAGAPSAEFLSKAEADFREALSGYNRDTWAARTYGLHFVEFFPNRELGVTYFQMGRLDEAEQYLNRSLGFVETERALYYLDEIKRARIARGEIRDEQAPAVRFAVDGGVLSSSREVPLRIQARDDVGVSELIVNGEPVYLRGSKQEFEETERLVFEEGAHGIQLDARDLADKQSSERIEVVVDLTAPTIAVFDPEPEFVTQAAQISLRGAVVDENGVAQVLLNDEVIGQSAGDTRIDFNAPVTLQDGENKFVLAATDLAGNENRAAIVVYRGAPRSAGAKLWKLHRAAPQELKYASAGGGLAPVIVFGAAGEDPVVVEVQFPTSGPPLEPYKKSEIPVRGEVRNRVKLASLQINDQLVAMAGDPGTHGFQRRIALKPDQDNTIKVVATDTGGKTYTAEKTIKAEFDLAHSPKTKLSMAVMAFRGVDANLGLGYRSDIERALISEQRFNIIDRLQMENILTEQHLSAGLLTDPEQSLRLGKIIAANLFVDADVILHEGAAVEIKARVLDTETSKIVASQDVHIQDKNNPKVVAFKQSALAKGLVKQFPRIAGQIQQVSAGKIVSNISTADEVRQGMYLAVFVPGSPIIDETTGAVLIEDEDKLLGKAQIVNINEKVSLAQPVPPAEGEEPVQFEAGMSVITM